MTLVELLVGLLLSSVLLLGAMKFYMLAAKQAHDNQIRTAAFLQAQAVVQNIGFELRILGNGLPFDQANFQIGENTLSDPTKTEPIEIATATATNISFRTNETGDVFLLTQDFHPTLDLEIHLTDVSSLHVNDEIYISNSVVSGDDGFYGVIEAVDIPNSTVTIAAGYVNSPGSTFQTGSVLEEVPMVNYNYNSFTKTITRNSGFGAVTIANNATLSFDFLDSSGTSLTLPLTNAVVINSLRAITVTVSIESDTSLTSTGAPHIATATQTFGLRNLTYLF